MSPEKEKLSEAWFLYLLECLDGSIYTGITKNLAARYTQHLRGKGARYTKSHPPKKILASCQFPDHSSALKAECRIKKLRAEEKRRLAAALNAPAMTVQCLLSDRFLAEMTESHGQDRSCIYNAEFVAHTG